MTPTYTDAVVDVSLRERDEESCESQPASLGFSSTS